jgi:hypothetical protein
VKEATAMRTTFIALAAVLLSTIAVPARAVVLSDTDHLKCYKAKDRADRTKYTADLLSSAPSVLPTDTGCEIRVPATLLCDAVAASFDPTPPLRLGQPLAELFVCYKLKCPKRTIDVSATDEFGTRTVTVGAPRYLCAPANVGAD